MHTNQYWVISCDGSIIEKQFCIKYKVDINAAELASENSLTKWVPTLENIHRNIDIWKNS